MHNSNIKTIFTPVKKVKTTANKNLNKMKNTLELLKTIDASKFYCITLWERTLELQGNATSENIEYCKTLGITNFESKYGHLNASLNNIKICLTF